MNAPSARPPITPAATAPGPQPQPRRHCAEASVAVAASVPAMVAAATKAVRVFLIAVSLGRWCAGLKPDAELVPSVKNGPKVNRLAGNKPNQFVGILIFDAISRVQLARLAGFFCHAI